MGTHEIFVCRRGLDHDEVTKIEATISLPGTKLVVVDAIKPGASPQRQQVFDMCCTDFVLFIDDDVDLDHDCIANLNATLSTIRDLAACAPASGTRIISRLDGSIGRC